MKCPNCSSEVAEGVPICPMCGFCRPSSPAAPVPIPSAAACDVRQEPTIEVIQAPVSGGAPAWLYATALLPLAGVAWFFLRPVPGLPVPAGAYEDAQSHFAVTAPSPDWVRTSTQEKRGDLVEAVAFRKSAEGGDLQASLGVFVRPQTLPDFSQEAKPRILATALDELKALHPDFQQAGTEEVSVDNLRAMRVTGWFQVKPAAVAASTGPVAVTQYQTTALLVPGADKAYLVVAAVEAHELTALQPSLDAALSSFRVTARPLAHQEAVSKYSRTAGLAGLALVVLMFAFKIVRGFLNM